MLEGWILLFYFKLFTIITNLTSPLLPSLIIPKLLYSLLNSFSFSTLFEMVFTSPFINLHTFCIPSVSNFVAPSAKLCVPFFKVCIELVSSTCFNSILYKNPLPIDEFKPFLYDTIRNMIKA